MKKVLLTTVMSLMMCMGVYAQDYLNPPKANEKVLGSITIDDPIYNYGSSRHSTCGQTKQEWYEILLQKAMQDYSGKTVDIRELTVGRRNGNSDYFYSPTTGKVVVDKAECIKDVFPQALNKALRNVRESSRIAIDVVTVSGGVSINREDFKDQVVDALLDKGYKVVAKEYLDKLYEEQQGQQSGIYNERTTVQENNFSAVGYFINVKVTETSLRVQVVNVSTGEYEGNATVNF